MCHIKLNVENIELIVIIHTCFYSSSFKWYPSGIEITTWILIHVLHICLYVV